MIKKIGLMITALVSTYIVYLNRFSIPWPLNQYIGDIFFGFIVYTFVQWLPLKSTLHKMFVTVGLLVPLSIVIRLVFSYPILYFLVGMDLSWIHIIGGAIGALLASEVDDILIKIIKKSKKL